MSASKSQKSFDDPNRYPVTEESMKHRVALLITNKVFQGCSNRAGADMDEKAMKELLTLLGYKVFQYQNQSAEEMKVALTKFSKLPNLKKTDSIFVVMMSHGDEGMIIGRDYCSRNKDTLKIDDIYTHLNSINCPDLLDTPKIIIIQACRGSGSGSVNVPDKEKDKVPKMETDFKFGVKLQWDALSHVEANFSSLRSCTPHTVSYRDPNSGSIFIQELVQVFNKNYKHDHIDELFRKVMNGFSNEPVQMPTIERETLMKRFYLLPESMLCANHLMPVDGDCPYCKNRV